VSSRHAARLACSARPGRIFEVTLEVARQAGLGSPAIRAELQRIELQWMEGHGLLATEELEPVKWPTGVKVAYAPTELCPACR
jgi:hypothetical protein